MEHASRTGRDFDVVLTTPGARPVFLSVSELLPRAWHKPCGPASDDARDFPDTEAVFDEPAPPRVGSEFVDAFGRPGAPRCMALVWDGTFCPDAALVKFKYEKTADGHWRKLPHAYTESAAYLRYLVDNRCGDRVFQGLARLKIPEPRYRDGASPVLF